VFAIVQTFAALRPRDCLNSGSNLAGFTAASCIWIHTVHLSLFWVQLPCQ